MAQTPPDSGLRAPRVLRNAALLAASSAMNFLLYGLTSILVAKLLGSEHLGRYATVVATVQMLSSLGDLGVSSVLLRELSKHRTEEAAAVYLGASVRLRLRLTLAAYGLLAVVVFAMGYPPAVKAAAFILGLTLFLGIVSSEVLAVIRAWERMEIDAVVGVGTAILNLGLSYVVLSAGYGIRALACVAVLVSCIGGLSLLVLCHRLVVRLRLQRRPGLTGELFQAAWPVGVGSLMYGLYDRVDILFLWKFTSPAETGVYSVAYQLLGVGKLLVGAAASAVVPALSSLAHHSTREQLLGTTRSAIRMMSVLGGTYVLFAWFLAEPVVVYVLGPSYAGAAVYLRVLAFSAGIISVGTIFGNLLIACDIPRAYLYLSGLGLVLNLGLNASLVPRLGAEGAAWATLLTDGLASFAAYALVCRHLGYIPMAMAAGRVAALGVATGLAWQYLGGLLHPALAAGVALALYTVLLFTTGAISRNEIRIVRSMLQRKQAALSAPPEEDPLAG